MFAGLQAQELYAYISDTPPASVEQLRERYARLASGKSPDGGEAWLNWMVNVRASEVLVGYVQATIRDERASIGYALFPSSWGRGYGFEAVMALLAELRGNSIREIVATVDTRNVRSIALLERASFKVRKITRDAEVIHGVSTDEYEYAYANEGH